MMARGMNSPKQMALWTIALLDEWEEKRHQAPEQAGKILKQSDVLSGTLNLEEGLSKIVGDNRRTIAKGAK
jgi:hypothetical protein